MFSLLSSARSVLQRAAPSSAPRSAPGLARFRHGLAPRKITYLRRHKGTIPVPIGGSIKGTTLAYGDWGIRIVGDGARLSAPQLLAAQEAVQKKIKPIKGAKVYMRVFPDVPVCIKVCTNAGFTRRR